jgi:CheY-like chemotaxis protein
LISSLSTLVRRSLPESIAMVTELPDPTLHALVDPGQLESALLNFALNARDAMPDGGRLRISAAATALGRDAAAFDVPPGDYALIEVEDDGVGMDAATLARVFEPFFTTKRLGLGSGLGMSMTHSFARQSGGGIAIASTPGQGTTIRMVLPLARPEAPDALAVSEMPVNEGGELVLLVEDEPNVRRVVRQQLMALGHPVIEAENGAQALAMIEQVEDIGVVLSDIVMPGGINGRQLAAAATARRPGTRVVLMSGYSDDPRLPGPGNDELPVLAKPFAREDLARALQQAIREGRNKA